MDNTTPQNNEETAISRNISMYATQWAAVEEINNRFDFRNLSIALRFLINDYLHMKNRQLQQEADLA